MTNKLLNKKCVPCEDKSMDPFTPEEARNYMPDVPEWVLAEDGKSISREFKFADFIGSINFINNVADIAEEEGHHPDIEIHYNKVKLTLSTHSIGGLSENDFIVAAKVDAHRA
ncbi:MAG TPA: 4a-hydroxytetrahydrobiopterin dehydratase [Candidatus Paceibacterota bacterium]